MIESEIREHDERVRAHRRHLFLRELADQQIHEALSALMSMTSQTTSRVSIVGQIKDEDEELSANAASSVSLNVLQVGIENSEVAFNEVHR